VQRARHIAGEWIVSLPQSDGLVRFASIGLDVALDDVYAGTEL
jgi:hypothetical protein